MTKSKELNLEENRVRALTINMIFVASLIIVGSAWMYILVSGLLTIRDILFGN
jgi:predicted nucleic acid-binding Zn ribbon protein